MKMKFSEIQYLDYWVEIKMEDLDVKYNMKQWMNFILKGLYTNQVPSKNFLKVCINRYLKYSLI